MNNTALERVVDNPCKTFVVTGPNWSAEVVMDAFNSQFPMDTQIMEAASRAVAVWKDIEPPTKHGVKIIPFADNAENEKLKMGTTLLIHELGQDPNNSFLAFSHIIFANLGLYRDSIMLETTLKKQVEQINARMVQELAAKGKTLSKTEKAQEAQRLEYFKQLKECTFPAKPGMPPQRPPRKISRKIKK